MSWAFNIGISRVCAQLLALISLVFSFGSFAEQSKEQVESNRTAHEVVQGVTDQMLSVINESETLLSESPQKFYSEVERVLEPVVDFKFIARGVMGNYAKKAAPEQRDRFADSFKQGLVKTYAKGMAGFGDKQIVVLPPKGDISGQRRVSVTQEVHGDDGVNRVSYTMMKKKTGEWKLVNVVLNGVNLGKTFRSQFAQAMKKEGDLNSVIDNWSLENK